MVKEELCEEVAAVRRVCDKVMADVLVFEEEVQRQICGHTP